MIYAPDKIMVCGIEIPKINVFDATSVEYNLKSSDIFIKIYSPGNNFWMSTFNINKCSGKFTAHSLEDVIYMVEDQYLNYYSNLSKINSWAERQLKTKILK